MLEFRGIQKLTLVDYPDEVACTLFLGGCNWRCGYCFNRALALNEDTGLGVSETDALEFLQARRGFLDGICVTGGEPLVHGRAVLEFLKKVKALGFKTKLDTNGSFPAILQEILAAGAADYVAMDIKAPLEKYAQVVGCPIITDKLAESAQIIQQSGLDYEFRTTVFSDLTLDDFDAIGRWLDGSRKYCLQQGHLDLPTLDESFRITHGMVSAQFLEGIAARLRPHFGAVKVRAQETATKMSTFYDTAERLPAVAGARAGACA